MYYIFLAQRLEFFQLFVQNSNQVGVLGILSPSTSFKRFDIEMW